MSLPFAKKIRMWSSALAIVAGMGVSAEARAQAPVTQTAAAMPTKYVVHNTLFHLPFKIGPAAQATSREMQLWMRDDSGHWKLVDRVAPSGNHFTCRVPRDGEYGFSIVTVDRRGVASPRNVTQRAPELMVVVEARQQTLPGTAPAAEVVPATAANMPSSTPDMIVPAFPVQRSGGNQPLPSVAESVAPTSEPAPLPFAADNIAGPHSGTGMTMVKQSATPAPVSRPQSPPAPADIVTEITDQGMPQEAELPGANTILTSDRTVKGPVVLLVNNTHVSVEYNVGKAGPSGLAKVMVYGTSDQGRTWECLGEDADHHSPAEITLPGEGTYGIRMSGINGNGFGGKAPAAGEQPATTIEVDLTKPKIQGWKAGLGKSGSVEVRWKITDKNLGNQAVSLFYRTGRTGAWKPMATKLKSEGTFRWSITQDLAPQYYIRLEATDLAGNLAHVESQNPVLVDRTAPDINVTGVSVIQNQPTETNSLVPASGEAHDGNE